MEESLLAQRRAALTKRWIDAVLKTYSADAAGFMRRQKDAFANPAGHLVRECVPVLIDALEHGVERDKVGPPLEALLKLRALQDFAPSQAVAFLFTAKTMLREELDLDPHARSGKRLTPVSMPWSWSPSTCTWVVARRSTKFGTTSSRS